MGVSCRETRRYVDRMAAFARQIEAEAWPLVVMTPSAFATRFSLDGLEKGLLELLGRGEPFCLLGDLTHKSCMELIEVRHLSELLRTHGPRLDELVAAFGLAVPSPMVRGAIKLVLDARRPRHPYSVLRSRRDARRYVDPYLQALRMPAAVGH